MKNKKLIIVLAVAVVALDAVIAVILTHSGENGGNENKEITAETIANNLEVDKSANGIGIVGIQNIAGVFVEDGSDEVMGNIFTVDFRNDSDHYLQYAEIALTIDGEEYSFKLTTVPSGATVRAMEANRSEMPHSCEECEMRCEHIAWFGEEPSLHSDAIEIIEQDGGLVVKNISGQSIPAPIYVYYKNLEDDVYVGGITYRATITEELAAGETFAVGAGHFNVGHSRIMFVEYAE